MHIWRHLNRPTLWMRLTNSTESRVGCVVVVVVDVWQKWKFAKRAFRHEDMLIWASFRSHRCASVNRLCHLSALRSISGIAFTVNHYYGHSVHILNTTMFVPFRPFILMMPHNRRHHRRHTFAIQRRLFSAKYLHAMAMWCDAHATSTLTLETFKTHFKMIFCNELRTRRWVVCVLCHSRRTRCSSHSTENY